MPTSKTSFLAFCFLQVVVALMLSASKSVLAQEETVPNWHHRIFGSPCYRVPMNPLMSRPLVRGDVAWVHNSNELLCLNLKTGQSIAGPIPFESQILRKLLAIADSADPEFIIALREVDSGMQAVKYHAMSLEKAEIVFDVDRNKSKEIESTKPELFLNTRFFATRNGRSYWILDSGHLQCLTANPNSDWMRATIASKVHDVVKLDEDRVAFIANDGKMTIANGMGEVLKTRMIELKSPSFLVSLVHHPERHRIMIIEEPSSRLYCLDDLRLDEHWKKLDGEKSLAGRIDSFVVADKCYFLSLESGERFLNSIDFDNGASTHQAISEFKTAQVGDVLPATSILVTCYSLALWIDPIGGLIFNQGPHRPDGMNRKLFWIDGETIAFGGGTIAFGGFSSSSACYNLRRQSLEDPSYVIRGTYLASHPSTSQFAICRERRIEIVDKQGTTKLSIPVDDFNSASAVAFNTAGDRLRILERSGIASEWDTTTGDQTAEYLLFGGGKRPISKDLFRGPDVRRYGKILGLETTLLHSRSLFANFHSDGRWLFGSTDADNQSVWVFDMDEHRLHKSWQLNFRYWRDGLMSDQGDTFIVDANRLDPRTLAEGKSLTIHVMTNAGERQITMKGDSAFLRMFWLCDGDLFGCSINDLQSDKRMTSIHIYSVSDPEFHQVKHLEDAWLGAIALSPDTRWLAVDRRDGTFQILSTDWLLGKSSD